MQMNVSDAVETVVRALLPRFSPDSTLLHVCIVAKAAVFDGDEEQKESRQIHLLFHRPGNYTKVFWHVVENNHIRVEDVPKDGWTLESDHDSCWTSDGLESPLRKVRDSINEKFSNPECMSWHINFDIFGGVNLFEAAEVKKILSEPNKRKYMITLGSTKKGLSI